ncbi:MAG: pilin [Patescibacteria group bacterium]
MKLKRLSGIFAAVLLAFVLPLSFVHAAVGDDIKNNPVVEMMQMLLDLIDYILVPLIFALAFIAFLWGVFTYFIAGAADEEKRDTGKKFVTYGLIGFFVMVSVWGIVNLLVNSFFGGVESRPDLPTFDQSARESKDSGTSTPCPTGETCIEGTNIPSNLNGLY